MTRTITIMLAVLSVPSASLGFFEDLDEMETRISRRSVNTLYTGDTPDNNWVRQPQTLSYTDVTTGREVWVMTSTDDQSNIFYTDISPANPWSADGSRLGFFSTMSPNGFFTRYAGSTLDIDKGTPYVVRTDGSHMRAAGDSANRTWGSSGVNYFWWSPVVPDVYYTHGGRENGLSLDANALYKNTVSDNSISYSLLVDVISGDTTTNVKPIKKIISPDGTTLMGQSGSYPNTVFWPITIYPEVYAGLLDSDGWAEQRGQTDEWAGGDPFACKHDAYMPSSSFAVFLFSYDCNNVSPVFYKYNVTGSETDGGPKFVPSETEYTNFNDFETEPLWTTTPTNVPWKLRKDTNPSSHGWGHPGFGRWGRIVIYHDGNGFWDGGYEYGGPVAWDYINRDLVADPGASIPYVLTEAGSGDYIDWNAWSDYFVLSKNASDPATYEDSDRWILVGEYNKLDSDGNNWSKVTYHHGNRDTTTGDSYQWTSNSRVAQSPDGTKVSYALTFLTNTVTSTGDIAYAVAYNPHPPEVSSVISGSVRFSWNTGGISRGYTQRGWPDEATDDPPPPRETSMFRLWKSADGVSNWQPVATVNADIFNRYDFSTGKWIGQSYWEITDPSPSGYYAVTSVEWSGLESQVLSNVYSADGNQFSAYPVDPKGDSNFTTEYNSEYVRYYNIYAADGSAPTATQQDRIASVPVASGTSYVDWLGDTSGTTQYLVTAVDTQGNESSPLNSTATHKQSPATADGQYTISWSSEYQGGGQTQPGTGRFSTGTGTIIIQ